MRILELDETTKQGTIRLYCDPTTWGFRAME